MGFQSATAALKLECTCACTRKAAICAQSRHMAFLSSRLLSQAPRSVPPPPHLFFTPITFNFAATSLSQPRGLNLCMLHPPPPLNPLTCFCCCCSSKLQVRTSFMQCIRPQSLFETRIKFQLETFCELTSSECVRRSTSHIVCIIVKPQNYKTWGPFFIQPLDKVGSHISVLSLVCESRCFFICWD